MSSIFLRKRCVLVPVAAALLLSSAGIAAQDPAKLVTRAEVEKVTGATFNDGTQPMAGQVAFQEKGGDLQVSVDIEKPEAGNTVRSWEATIKNMSPSTRVDTVPGIGRDAIFYSTRKDSGALSADFDKPRVQLRVAVAGAATTAQAKQIVVDLARIVGPRVGK